MESRQAAASGKAIARRAAFLSLLALSYLQYYFIGVLTEIDALPALIVFAPAKPLSPLQTGTG